jgi:hypothetical protein
MTMTYETPKEKKLLDELKGADDFAVEKDLNEEDLEAVSGGCLCRCGGDYSTCGGGGGGNSLA